MGKRGGVRPGSGRKKGYAWLAAEKGREMVCKILEEQDGDGKWKGMSNFEVITRTAVTLARKGDRYARDWVSERGHGKVAQPVVGDKDADPIQVSITAPLKKIYGK